MKINTVFESLFYNNKMQKTSSKFWSAIFTRILTKAPSDPVIYYIIKITPHRYGCYKNL